MYMCVDIAGTGNAGHCGNRNCWTLWEQELRDIVGTGNAEHCGNRNCGILREQELRDIAGTGNAGHCGNFLNFAEWMYSSSLLSGFVPLISLRFAELICCSSLLSGSVPQVRCVDSTL